MRSLFPPTGGCALRGVARSNPRAANRRVASRDRAHAPSEIARKMASMIAFPTLYESRAIPGARTIILGGAQNRINQYLKYVSRWPKTVPPASRSAGTLRTMCRGQRQRLPSPKKAASVAMSAAGAAPDTVSGRATRESAGNEFLADIAARNPELSARWGLKWGAVPEVEVTTQEFWGHVATFLATRTKKKGRKGAGKGYASGTATAMWTGLLHTERQRFKASELPQTRVRACTCPPSRAHMLHACQLAFLPLHSSHARPRVFLACLRSRSSTT